MSAWLLGVCLLAFAGACQRGVEQAPGASDGPTVILPRDAEELDPRFVMDPYGLKVSRLIFASLMTIDPRTLEVVPDLAERIELEGERGYHVWLKSGLRFSDGSVLDAEDVVATFEGLRSEELGSLYRRSYARIERIEQLGPLEVRFVLSESHATFLTDLEVPIVRSEDAFSRIREGFVGAGPYRLVARSSGNLRLEANPHWHRGAARHEALRFVVIRDENTRALRLQGQAGDLCLNGIGPLLLPLFEEDPNFEVRSEPGIGTSYLGFRTDRGPLRDLRLREAIAHAIDRELLIATELGGRAELTESWVPTGHWSSVELPPRRHDPEVARRLIADAGAEGTELLLRTSNDRGRLSVARAMAAMLEEVGFAVTVRPSETATLIADLNAGRFDLTLLQVPEVFEPHVLSWFFASERIPAPGHPGANRWRIRSAALDAALERGRATPVLQERQAAYREAQGILQQQLPVFPLWQEHSVAVYRRGLDFDVPRDGRFSTLAW